MTDLWDDVFTSMMTPETFPDMMTKDIENEIEHFTNLQPQTEPKLNLCPTCNIAETEEIDNVFYCKSCGLERDVQSAVEDNNSSSFGNYNVNTDYSLSFKMIGKNAFNYNKNMMSASSDYTKQAKSNILKEYMNIIEGSSISISKNVILLSTNLFLEIKNASSEVYRKDTKKGIMAVCLYNTCYHNEMAKTIPEIISIFKITLKIYNNGDKKIRELKEKKIIVFEDINTTEDHLERYLELLKIDKKWKVFILEIIEKANSAKLHIIYDTKQDTRCIGVIYLLCDRHPDYKHITKEVIEKICSSSKNTFTKYCNNVIYNFYKKYRNIFKKYGVPMKKEWKKNYVKQIEIPKKGRPKKNNEIN